MLQLREITEKFSCKKIEVMEVEDFLNYIPNSVKLRVSCEELQREFKTTLDLRPVPW